MTRSDLLEMMEPHYERKGKDECWNWTGRITTGGYSQFWMGRQFRPTRIHGHRLMFQIMYGPIPQELQACHHCDNRKCVNPHHLFLGDHLANAQDRVRKGRSFDCTGIPNTKNRGMGNGNSRLTTAQLHEIRLMLKEGVHQTVIAAKFPISQTGVSDIKRGVSYVGQ